MIKITTGAPGNGKSLLVQSETIEEYLHGDRDIVTSTPVRINPWVTGDGRCMLGLREFLRLECGLKELPEEERIAPGVVAFGRMLVVEDEDQLGDLFMWRVDRQTGKWFKCRWDTETEKFNAEDLARMRGGCLVVTDEAWKCYNSRRWKDTEKVVEFYGRQHRKFSDDWIIVSHSHKDLDVQLNRMTQAWRICMNYGLRRLGWFRQPPLFEVKTYYEAPSSPNVRCFHAKITRLNPKVCQTYDTSAGVAVGGGRAADVTRRKPGLSPWWALAGGVALLIAIFVIPSQGMKIFLRPFTRKNVAAASGVKKAVNGEGARLVSTPQGRDYSAMVDPVKVKAVSVETNRLDMVGYAVTPKIVYSDVYGGPAVQGKSCTVNLSDGSRFHSGDGHLQYLCDDYCIVDGHTNWYRPVAPVVPAVVSGAEAPAVAVANVPVQSYEAGDGGGSSLYVIPYHHNSMARPNVRDVVSGRGYGQSVAPSY